MSGESAAAILTKYIHPETVTVYGRPNLKRLVSKLGNIAKDESGALEIIDRFWNFDVQLIKKGYKICPLPLVYADLLATGEARQLDAASMLGKQYTI